MPTERFKSKEAYRKWSAYRHIHGIAAPNLTTAIVAGKPHRVKHSSLSKQRVGVTRRKGGNAMTEAHRGRRRGRGKKR